MEPKFRGRVLVWLKIAEAHALTDPMGLWVCWRYPGVSYTFRYRFCGFDIIFFWRFPNSFGNGSEFYFKMSFSIILMYLSFGYFLCKIVYFRIDFGYFRMKFFAFRICRIISLAFGFQLVIFRDLSFFLFC
jgi:hypothetical protein